MPDRRPARLPVKLDRLLADRESIRLGLPQGLSRAERKAILKEMPRFEAACLDHGDLHKNNLLILNGQFWLIDRGHASLSHPFCSLLVTLDSLGADFNGPDSRGRFKVHREAYLAPWENLAQRPVLEKQSATALWAGHICRALNFQHMLTFADEDFWRKFRSHIALWLRKWYANRGLFN